MYLSQTNSKFSLISLILVAMFRSVSNCEARSGNLLVGCIYHSPSKPISDSIPSLCKLLRNINNYSYLYTNMQCFLTYSGTTSNSNIAPFIDTINDLILFQHITEPTRYVQTSTAKNTYTCNSYNTGTFPFEPPTQSVTLLFIFKHMCSGVHTKIDDI